jgi:hypothetical protein
MLKTTWDRIQRFFIVCGIGKDAQSSLTERKKGTLYEVSLVAEELGLNGGV